MTTSPSLAKTARQVCRNAFEGGGFRFLKGSFVTELGEGLLGCVKLGTAAYPAERKYLIGPVVGVRNMEVERRVGDWWLVRREALNGKQLMATASTPLGYIMPEQSYKSWHFSPDKDATSLAQDMIFSVEVFGLPWMKSLTDPRNLLNWLLEKQAASPDFRKFAIPALYCLLGETDRAREYIRQVVREIDDNGPGHMWSGYIVGWADDYKRVMLNV